MAIKIFDGTQWVELLKGSDISSWAKQPNKPSYNFSEISNRYDTLLGFSGSAPNLSGDVSPVGMALSNEHSANRLAFINPDALYCEYSTDGINFAEQTSMSNSGKVWMVTRSYGMPIGRNESSTEYQVGSKTRLTITGTNANGTQYLYCSPKKMLINVSSSGGMSVLVEYRTGTNTVNDGEWYEYGTYSLVGWSGWNEIPLVMGTLGGYDSQYGNNWQLRLTFIMTSKNTDYPTTAYVNSIRLFADNCWYAENNLANLNTIYSFDDAQNVYFPNNIYEGGTALSSKYAGINHSHSQSSLTSWLGLGYLNNNTGWGTLTAANGYTVVWGSDQPSGGGLVFAEKNGQTSMQLDGHIYDDEGRYQLLSTNSISSYAVTSINGMNGPVTGIATQNWVSNNYQPIGSYAGTAVATPSSNGLMSAADKTNLDAIVTSLNEDDNDSVVNRLKDVLSVFQNYPEGTTVLNALNGKVNTGTVATTGSLGLVYLGQAEQNSQMQVMAGTVAPQGHTHSNYLTGITSAMVTTALGFTPYNSSNPNGYTSNTGTVTSVNNVSPDANGNVSLTIPTQPTLYLHNVSITDSNFNRLTISLYSHSSTAISSIASLMSALYGSSYNVGSFIHCSFYEDASGFTYMFYEHSYVSHTKFGFTIGGWGMGTDGRDWYLASNQQCSMTMPLFDDTVMEA